MKDLDPLSGFSPLMPIHNVGPLTTIYNFKGACRKEKETILPSLVSFEDSRCKRLGDFIYSYSGKRCGDNN